MNERALLAVLAAIIWSQQRAELQEEAADNDDTDPTGPDSGSIAEAVSYAGDILVEVDEYLKAPAKSRVIDAEIVELEPGRRRR